MRRWKMRTLSGLLLAAVTTTGLPGVSSAAVSFSASSVSASVDGSSVVFSALIRASSAEVVGFAGICVRGADGAVFDPPKRADVVLTRTGSRFKATAELPAGTYRYWPCVQNADVWSDIPVAKTVTVPAGDSGSGPMGNTAKWNRTFVDNFDKSAAAGSFLDVYGAKWSAYDGFQDTNGFGTYDDSIISAHDGVMDIHLRRENGTNKIAAPEPLLGGSFDGQTYGRYSVRFKADSINGFKAIWMLWPASNIWARGEIDFAEGLLDGDMLAFNHCIGRPALNCFYADAETPFAGWHTTTVEWTPTTLTYIVDDRVIGTTTNNIPSVPMRMILQTEAAKTNVTDSGHILVDWVSVHSYAG